MKVGENMDKFFVLITHGNFATGIKTTLEMIVGNQENIDYIDCYIKKEFDIEVEVSKILNKYKNQDIIFLTDIYGGSVNNYILSLLNNENIYLISGFNLPLIMNLIENQELSTNEMIENSIDNARNQIKQCKLLKIEDEDF